jgi:Flp pilus assembly protein TadG
MMKFRLNRMLKSNRGRKGSVMLEFAAGSGLLLAAFAGTFQFGYTFYLYNSLATAVNDGAHYAALRTYDSSSSTPSNTFQTAVQNMVVYGSPAGGTTPIAPGLTTSNVTLTVTFTNSVPTAMTVAITGYQIDAIFAQNTFNKPQFTYPYQGIYSPY